MKRISKEERRHYENCLIGQCSIHINDKSFEAEYDIDNRYWVVKEIIFGGMGKMKFIANIKALNTFFLRENLKKILSNEKDN